MTPLSSALRILAAFLIAFAATSALFALVDWSARRSPKCPKCGHRTVSSAWGYCGEAEGYWNYCQCGHYWFEEVNLP